MNKRTIILSVMAIGILCLSVMGLSFAYFSATTTKNEKVNVSVETSNNAYIFYDTGKELTLNAKQPGYSGELTFSVKLVGDTKGIINSIYDINWIVESNSFEYDPNSTEKVPELLYDVYMSTDNNTWNEVIVGGDATELKGKKTLIDNQEISVDANKEITQYWKVVLTYTSLDKDQSYNMNKEFISSIKVENVE